MFWGYSKWCQIKKCSRFSRRSIFKLVVAAMSTPREIYKRICYVYREAYLSKKKYVTNWLNFDFLQLIRVEKSVDGEEIYKLLGKENISGAEVYRKCHAKSILGHEMSYLYIAFKKKSCEIWFILPTRKVKFTHYQVGGVFTNSPGDRGSIPGCVVPKTWKMVLDTSLLNTQHYKVRIKCKVKQ